MKRMIVCLVALLVCGCDAGANNQKRMGDLTYTKDYRTELCFATYAFGSQSAMLTNVPCSPAVEAEVAKNVKRTNDSHP